MHLLPAHGAAGLDGVALLFAYIAEAHAVSGEVEYIPVLHDGARALNLVAVDPDAALGEDIKYAPDTLGAADKNRVHTADGLIGQAYVRRAGAAYEIFPVVYQRNALVLVYIAPDLRL